MPRTRSSATLQACKRTNKINEPFAVRNVPNYNLNKNNKHNFDEQELKLNWWNMLAGRMNQPDTAVKIFGQHLTNYANSMVWFEQTKTTHEIFTLIRNPREMILSYLLAFHLGYTKSQEIEDKQVTITDIQFSLMRNMFNCFLKFYPSSGVLVTFETLPEEFFDKTQINFEEQHSMSKLHLIKNMNEVEANIDSMLCDFKEDWKHVTGVDINSIPASIS